jgi:hypothetical protein
MMQIFRTPPAHDPMRSERRGWDAGGQRWQQPAPRRRRVSWELWALAALLAFYLAGIFVLMPLLIHGRLG